MRSPLAEIQHLTCADKRYNEDQELNLDDTSQCLSVYHNVVPILGDAAFARLPLIPKMASLADSSRYVTLVQGANRFGRIAKLKKR